MPAITLMAVLLVGLAAGVLSGLLGVGGGTITIPAMVFFLGVSQKMAQGISLAVIVPTAIVGSYGYFLRKNTDMKTALLLASGAVVGALLGSAVACNIPAHALKIVFGIFAVIIGGKIIRDVFSEQK